MFAQSLGEYGAFESITSTIQSVIYSARSWLGEIGPMTWGLIAVVLLGLFVFRRR